MRTPRNRSLLSPGARLALSLTLAVGIGCATPSTEGDPPGTSSGSSGGSGTSGASGSSGTSGTSGATGGSSGTTGGSSGTSGTSGASGSSSGGVDPTCAGTVSTAEPQPIDLYVMLDRSASMNDFLALGSRDRKWDAITSALSSFVGQPMTGTSVGLQYFPPTQGDACQVASYATPAVEIGPLSQTGAAIVSSMGAQRPVGLTPTIAALQSAIDHARAWAASPAHAKHAVHVVFATDGAPTLCDGNLTHIGAVAAGGLNASPSIRTFVIGVGVFKDNLDGIAAAGGTTAAFIVNADPNMGAAFLKALNDIRRSAVGCSYAIPAAPAGQTLDLGLVNVVYQPGAGGAATPFSRVADAAACGAKGTAWHYDRATDPGSIVLCPSTCTAVQGDPAASVRIALGCQTLEW